MLPLVILVGPSSNWPPDWPPSLFEKTRFKVLLMHEIYDKRSLLVANIRLKLSLSNLERACVQSAALGELTIACEQGASRGGEGGWQDEESRRA